MDAAEAAQKQNQGAQAMALYEQAAKTDPASKQPWLRMAQTYFDSRSYGQAITASQEALHRDNTDITAKSLMAASGLRVSADALEQLRQANAVNGSTRTEAQTLARIMRDAVGEAVFPPRPAAAPVAADPAPLKAQPRPVRRPPAVGTPATPGAPTTPAAAPAAATSPTTAPTTSPATAPVVKPPVAAPTPAAVPTRPAATTPAPASSAKPASPFDVLKKN